MRFIDFNYMDVIPFQVQTLISVKIVWMKNIDTIDQCVKK